MYFYHVCFVFISLNYVRPSLCLSGTSVHCDHTVHFSTYSYPSFFQFHMEQTWEQMCKVDPTSQERKKS